MECTRYFQVLGNRTQLARSLKLLNVFQLGMWIQLAELAENGFLLGKNLQLGCAPIRGEGVLPEWTPSGYQSSFAEKPAVCKYGVPRFGRLQVPSRTQEILETFPGIVRRKSRSLLRLGRRSWSKQYIPCISRARRKSSIFRSTEGSSTILRTTSRDLLFLVHCFVISVAGR